MVLSGDAAVAWGPGLAELANVSVIFYSAPGYDEMAIREEVKALQRSVGMESIREGFGLSKHSLPLLQDTKVHRQIQVTTMCMILLISVTTPILSVQSKADSSTCLVHKQRLLYSRNQSKLPPIGPGTLMLRRTDCLL